jgi:hypothetical protein
VQLPLIQTWRDFKEFLEAKKRKREPIRLKARGGSSASYVPSSPRGFENFRRSLRGVGDFGCASEGIDRLERELRSRHTVGLPVPRRVLQNEDCSVTLFWPSITVRCFTDRFFSMIGGTEGVHAQRITNELLDALYFQHRIQNPS